MGMGEGRVPNMKAMLLGGATISTDDMVMWDGGKIAGVVRGCAALHGGELALLCEVYSRCWVRGGRALYRRSARAGSIEVLLCGEGGGRFSAPHAWTHQADGDILALVAAV